MSVEVIGSDGRIKDRQGVPPSALLFRGQRTTDAALVAGWNGPYGFDELFDTGGAYNGTRFQPSVPGYYHLNASIAISGAPSGGAYEAAITKNTTGIGDAGVKTIASCMVGVRSDGWASENMAALVYLNGTTDYCEVFVYSPTAAGTVRGTAGEKTFFEGSLVGATVGVAPEPWHYVGGPGEPAFQNGWVNQGGGGNPGASFYKDPSGVVRLKGLVRNGTVSATIFALPAGYRPVEDLRFSTINNGVSSYTVVGLNGNVYTNGSNTSCDLAPISFRAEA